MVVAIGGAAAAQPCDPVWSTLGTGVNNSVDAVAIYNGDLYVGGLFSSAGGVADTLRIAR